MGKDEGGRQWYESSPVQSSPGPQRLQNTQLDYGWEFCCCCRAVRVPLPLPFPSFQHPLYSRTVAVHLSVCLPACMLCCQSYSQPPRRYCSLPPSLPPRPFDFSFSFHRRLFFQYVPATSLMPHSPFSHSPSLPFSSLTQSATRECRTQAKLTRMGDIKLFNVPMFVSNWTVDLQCLLPVAEWMLMKPVRTSLYPCIPLKHCHLELTLCPPCSNLAAEFHYSGQILLFLFLLCVFFVFSLL